MNYKTEEILIIILAFAILIATVFITKPDILAYVIYNPTFTYDVSLVSNVNGYSLIPITETTTIENSTNYNSSLTSAIYNGNDRTSKLQSKDNQILEVDRNKILDVTFAHELKNNDKVTLYIKGTQNNDIYLCSASTHCNSPGYGLVHYPGQEGYYTITISNLGTPTNIFNIDPLKTKLDYAYATYTTTTHTNITTTSYPSSAVLTSDFFEPANLASFGLLEKTEELNSQSILYEYTTDGINYNTITDFNLSYVNSPKIKFKVTLNSDTTNTPILHNLILNYYLTEPTNETIPDNETCTEDWRCSPWGTCIEGTQNRECTDLNSCGTILNKPSLTQNCIPECTEDWSCGNWTDCINSTQTRICTDLNECYTNLNKPLEAQECTMPPENNQTNETLPNNQTTEQPSAPSAGGGGGGNAAPSTAYQSTSLINPLETLVSPTETNKEQKIIPLYESKEPVQGEQISGGIVKEGKSTRYYVNVVLFSLFILVCYLFYRKLVKKI